MNYIAVKSIFNGLLAGYTVTSPFLFMWFHKNVLKEQWDNDMADRVTIRLYIISNIAAQTLAWVVTEQYR